MVGPRCWCVRCISSPACRSITSPGSTSATWRASSTPAAGVNHLGGITALHYARDPSISEQNRVLRQQNLLRAAINKVVHAHLLSNPLTTINVLNALTSALTVDSNFTNAEL